jgi:hypothetical protein
MATMLRINFDESEDEIGMTLEGRIAGPAVTELNRAWEEIAPRLAERHLWIDLRRVIHSDSAGKQALGLIYAQTHAKFLTRTFWSKSLAQEIMKSADGAYAYGCD